MSRGITESDVFTAADSLLVAGERPTVDRIRAVLGSGSPNTVIRHLDAWWAHAGQRLNASAQRMALPEAPEHVTALASAFWVEALTAARAEMAASLAGEHAKLVEGQAALEAAREHDLVQRAEQVAQLTRARDAHSAVSLQLAALEERQLTWDAERERLLTELQRQGAAADEDRRTLVTAQNALAELHKHADDERQASAAYARSVENRAHGAIDEARQELKALRHSLSATTREQAHRDAAHAREVGALTRAKISAERDVARLTGRVQALETTLATLKPAPRAAKKAGPATTKRPRSRKPPSA
jgi:chromosome segregation ATPase